MIIKLLNPAVSFCHPSHPALEARVTRALAKAFGIKGSHRAAHLFLLGTPNFFPLAFLRILRTYDLLVYFSMNEGINFDPVIPEFCPMERVLDFEVLLAFSRFHFVPFELAVFPAALHLLLNLFPFPFWLWHGFCSSW